MFLSSASCSSHPQHWCRRQPRGHNGHHKPGAAAGHPIAGRPSGWPSEPGPGTPSECSSSVLHADGCCGPPGRRAGQLGKQHLLELQLMRNNWSYAYLCKALIICAGNTLDHWAPSAESENYKWIYPVLLYQLYQLPAGFSCYKMDVTVRCRVPMVSGYIWSVLFLSTKTTKKLF